MKNNKKTQTNSLKQKETSTNQFKKVEDSITFFFTIIAPALLLFYWIQFVASPNLIYHKQSPPFFIDTPFIKEFLLHPDGLSSLLSSFIFQFHQFGVFGTISETVLAIAACLSGLFALRTFSNSKSHKFIFLIMAFAMLFHIDYKGNPFHALINTLFGFISFLLFARIYPVNTGFAFIIFTILCGLLTWGFTLGGFLFFMLSGLLALHVGNKKHLLIICPIYASLIYFLILRPGYGEQSFNFQESSWGKTAEIATILIAPLIIRIRHIIKKIYEKNLIQKSKFILKSTQSSILHASTSAAICLGLLFLANHYFDHNKKHLIQIDYFACNQQWNQTIETFAKLKTPNNTAIVQLRRSLLHSGKLLDDFFSYPQLKEKYFFPDYNEDPTVCVSLAEFFYELGHINFAEHLAHEALEFDGSKPRHLLLLSKINLLKGKTNAAKIFLYRLEQNPFYRKKAAKLLSDIENNEPFKDDEKFKSAQTFANTVSYAGYEVRDETFFNQLLVSNPNNRMAFECLIATLLANKNLPEAMRLIQAFAGFGFKTLPRHYEEAILVWQIMENHKQFVPAKYKISTAVYEKFDQFTRILQTHNGNLTNAKQPLAEQFGTTFWFYYLYDNVYNPTLQFYKSSQKP